VNLIAAGEVVERPASVVKELLENSVDAGATCIQINASNGGQDIRIADNGKGMSAQDVERCVLNHATSKIASPDDLASILTMGFRGEALASISAISRFSCQSRRAQDADGVRLVTSGDGKPSLTPVGCGVGTVMEVNDLFYNTPARLKFLKRPSTELAYIEEMVQGLALAHPHVEIELTLNDKLKFRTAGNGCVESTVRSIFKFRPEQEQHLLTTTYEDPTSGLILNAVFASPACERLQKKSRKQWSMLLNKRPIRCAVLQRAIANAYESLVPHGMSPFCAIWLEMPPSIVDVNVHPTKKEVRYEDGGQVYQFVYHGLRRALSSHFESVYGIAQEASAPSPLGERDGRTEFAEGKTRESWERGNAWMLNSPHSHSVATTQQAMDLTAPLTTLTDSPDGFAPSPLGGGLGRGNPTSPHDFSTPRNSLMREKRWRVIGQLYATYILIETANGLMVVDQHIASERWCFEEFQRHHDRATPVAQRFLTPLLLSVNGEEYDTLEQQLPFLESLGYQLIAQDSHTWQIHAIPILYPDRGGQLSPEQQLKHMLDELIYQNSAKMDTEYLYATLACHSAIRAGDDLSQYQMEKVVEDWLTCTLPWSCPHGRPIAHTIDGKTLADFFDRPSLPQNALS